MPNIVFSLLIAILSVHFFTLTYRVNGVNRVLFNVPISIFESSIPLVNSSDDPILYFDKEVLEDKLTSYFDRSLSKYIEQYTLSYYYYNQDDLSICKSDHCTSIEINLEANLFFNFTYEKSANFYIRSNVHE